MVLVDSSGVSRVPEYSGANRASQIFTYGALTLCGRPSQSVPLIFLDPMLWSYNPAKTEVSTVWAVPASLAATEGIDFSFSSCG